MLMVSFYITRPNLSHERLTCLGLDRLHHGSKLILRSKLMNGNTADDRQLWTLKTNGSIVSSSYHYIGLSLVRHGEGYSVELCDYKKYRKHHYDWTLSYAKYERRYSEIHKREILVIITMYKIILNWRNASSKGKDDH